MDGPEQSEAACKLSPSLNESIIFRYCNVYYTIPSNLLTLSPSVQVLSIGGGVTGILNAYQIQKYCSNVEHVIYEKNEDIGGAKVFTLMLLRL